MMQNHYGVYTTAIWRADQIEKWLEFSGPLYAEVPVKLVCVRCGFPIVRHDAGGLQLIDRQAVSYASWLMLLDAADDSELTIKIRVDEVAAARK